MPARVVSRTSEYGAVETFLDSDAGYPCTLVLEGDAGIGKTTLWWAGVQQARDRRYRVLATRASAAETVLAYGSLADLLGDVEASAWPPLPAPQRLAVDQVLLNVPVQTTPTDPRAVAAAFVAIVNHLARKAPVLLAIDDVQWLDSSTRNAIAFAARRFVGRVRVLATVRAREDEPGVTSWLRMRGPDDLERILVEPLDLVGLRAVLTERLGRSFSRPTMEKIHQLSGGNPFFGLELARSIDGRSTLTDVTMPRTLADLVQAQIGKLSENARYALLVASCVAAPTTELVADVAGMGCDELIDELEEAETLGIVKIEGHQLQFSHPLLARAAYSDAAAAQRRAVHRRLAEVVTEPEPKARHRALSATSSDPETLRLLDEAAAIAQTRGAPAAAAELLDLARGLGGDTAQRRISAALLHFSAGEVPTARSLLEDALGEVAPGIARAQAASVLGLVRLFDESFVESAELIEGNLADAGEDMVLRTQMLITLAFALFNAGSTEPALTRADEAVTTALADGVPAMLGQALGMRSMLNFIAGNGLDDAGLAEARAVSGDQSGMPVSFRPEVQYALMLAWRGELDEALDRMAAIRRGCVERGQESELTFVDFHTGLIEVWRGNLDAATAIGEDAVERARQLGGDLPAFVAAIIQASVLTYRGLVLQARAEIDEAIRLGKKCGSHRLAEWPSTLLGFLEIALGNHAAALDAVRPLLTNIESLPQGTEIISAAFLPDAIEAMVSLGDLGDAEKWTALLERNGERLDRSWMLAVGGRCRSMLLAARGDLDGAVQTAERALTEHDRVPMPFERARTKLLLGQLQRRQRRKDAAATTLSEVLATFERLGTPLWVRRTRAELRRVNVSPGVAGGLTPSERRVAELAATGMTNREVAAALFISPKTVEANLARVYRKLGIRSRAELGQRIGRSNGAV